MRAAAQPIVSRLFSRGGGQSVPQEEEKPMASVSSAPRLGSCQPLVILLFVSLCAVTLWRQRCGLTVLLVSVSRIFREFLPRGAIPYAAVKFPKFRMQELGDCTVLCRELG